jgi:GDP-4-dehydro-6-deoxy-D-mannose reductase
MRALVTGAAGFVGRHLVAHLSAHGDEVIGADRAHAPDLTDHEGWVRFVASIKPQVVYHLAAQTSVAASWVDPVGTYRANAEGTLAVLGACRDAGVERVLVISSSDVYGHVADAELPLAETAPTRPVTPYAASKLGAEAVARQAWYGHGLAVVVARAFNHTGPGQDPRFVAPALAGRIAAAERSGEATIAVGDQSARREFTDVRDVVRAYRLLVAAGEPGEIYNVCSGRDVAICDLAALLLARACVPLATVTDPALVRPVEVPVLVGTAAKLHAATGWEPQISLAQTAAELLDEARSRTS